MKIIITEDIRNQVLKRVFDKLKGKNGEPIFDLRKIRMIGLPMDNFRDHEEYREQFIQYIGGVEKAMKIAEDIVNDLKKEVFRLELNDNEGFVDIKIKQFENLGRQGIFDIEIVGGELGGTDIFEVVDETLMMGEKNEFIDYLRGSIDVVLEPKILKYSGIRTDVDGITFNESKLEDVIDESIVCENCGWSWKESESEPDDLYNCHKCGHNNNGGN